MTRVMRMFPIGILRGRDPRGREDQAGGSGHGSCMLGSYQDSRFISSFIDYDSKIPS